MAERIPDHFGPEKEVADYAMILDMIGTLTGIASEDLVIDKILELFATLYAPRQIFYVPMIDHSAGQLRARPAIPTDDEFIVSRLVNYESAYGWTASGTGFFLKIYSDLELIGIIEVDDLALPQHKEHYLNLALSSMSVLGLAVVNSRTYHALEESVTERKRAQELLLDQRNRAQNYLDVAGVLLLAVDANQVVTLINKKGCEILGYDENEIVGKNWFDNFLPKRIRADVKKVSAQLIAGDVEPVEHYENPVLTKSGEERLISWNNRGLRDEKGKIVAHLSSGEDITERRRAEEQINDLAKFTAENPFPVLRIAKDGTVLFANSAARPLLEERDVGQAAPTYWKKLSADVLKSGKVKKNVELEHEGRILSFTAVPVPEGDYVNLYGLDVTERKLSEQALLSSKEQRVNILESISDAFVAIDNEWRYTFANSKAEELLNLKVKNVIGRSEAPRV